MAKKIEIIAPQENFQTNFLSSSADIVIGGSAAGVGKTWALIAEPLRHIHDKQFRGVIFRKNNTHIKNPGGLLDETYGLYPICKAEYNGASFDWTFPSGAKISLRHLERYEDAINWQGAQVIYIAFDELTHFDMRTFFYIMTRARGMSGIRPYVRATCNPDPDSWVAKLVEWWIDEETGYPIKERDGVLRYFIRIDDNFVFGDTLDEVYEKTKHVCDPQIELSQGLTTKDDLIKSITFISGNIYDNKKLLQKTPGYVGDLISQGTDVVNQLLKGNWKMQISDNDIYNYYSFAGVFDNVREVDTTGSYITADIAMKGSNKLVVGLWRGFELVDIEVMDKSDGKQVIDLISEVAKFWNVENRYICYDADGVGAYVGGYLIGAIPFNGGKPAFEVIDQASGKKIKENYFNLKTQCYYRSGARANRGEMKISAHVASKMYDDKMTIRQRFMHERRAIKRDKVDSDGKLRIISKEAMKVMLGGESPDLMDMLMMREMFELCPAVILYDA